MKPHELKQLRKGMTLHEAIEWFKYPHFVRTIKNAPITIGTLSNFEEWQRPFSKAFLEAYVEHIKGKRNEIK